MDNLNTIKDIVAKYSHQLTIKELLAELSYSVDDIYVDKFWGSIEQNKWIYIDSQTLEWIGYQSTADARKIKSRYLELLGEFTSGKDYKQLNISELKDLVRSSDTPPDIPININEHNKVKHLIVTPRCFKETLMMLKTDKAKLVRKYYLDLEDIFKAYLNYQHEYMQSIVQVRDQEIQRIKNGSEHFKSIVINKNTLKRNQYIYVATSRAYASKNIFKVGMTTSFKDRLNGYQTGRCDDDVFKYLYIMPCVRAKELEQYIFTRLEFFKYYNSDGTHKKELYEIHYDLLLNILREFEAFEQSSTKAINTHLLSYYDTYDEKKPIDLDREAIVDISQYMEDRCDEEFKLDPVTPKDLTGSLLTNEAINADLNQYGLRIVSPYTGKCEEQQTYECLSILKHTIVVTHSHMNETKARGCVYCRKHNILEQVPIYVYAARTYAYMREYASFNDLKEVEPELNHQLLKNIIREERWLTVHNNHIYSILSPHNNKLQLDKPLTDHEQLIIDTLEIDYGAMVTRIHRSKMCYVMCLDHQRKRAIYGDSMTMLANRVCNAQTNKLVNRKSIAKHLDQGTHYAGYEWISATVKRYKNYQVVDCESL